MLKLMLHFTEKDTGKVQMILELFMWADFDPWLLT